MLIDSLAVPFSGLSGSRVISPDHESIIDGLKGLMLRAGWTLTHSYYASTFMSVPLSWPTVTAPSVPVVTKRPATCGVVPFVFLSFDGIRYSLYDPYTETPLESPTCKMVAIGLTYAATAANLAAAITSGRSGGWVAVVASSGGVPYGITITSLLPGPHYNGVQATVDGRWGGGNATAGGGWELRSSPNIDSSGNIRTTAFTVRMTGQVASSGDLSTPASVRVLFVFDTFDGSSTVSYSIDTYGMNYNGRSVTSYVNSSAQPFIPITQYTLVVNPYSFGLWDASEDAGLYYFRGVSLFAAAPYIPTEEGFSATPTTKAVIIIGPGCLRKNTSYVYSAVCLDAAPVYATGPNPYVRVLAMRSPGTAPLKTPSGAPLVTNAWVMYARNAASIPAVVGKLWDCAVVSDLVDEGLTVGNKRYVRMSQQDGIGRMTRSSLAFCVDGL